MSDVFATAAEGKIETWERTTALRWHKVQVTTIRFDGAADGVTIERRLEQAYIERGSGKVRWVEVPEA